MSFVLDASACLPWCFRDEATPETETLLLAAQHRERIAVPSHWPTEVLNGLSRAVRRGRITDDVVDRFLEDLLAYNVVVDSIPIAQQWEECVEFVRLYHLSAYDAAYLALARRLDIPLATFDERLRDAARLEDIALKV